MNTMRVPTDDALHALGQTVAEVLGERGLMLASAESCTGGWIAKVLTDISGSSAWFASGAVTYSNEAKQSLLGVTAATLARVGAVSGECAREMAAGALACFDADVAVAVTGIAGPAGGTPDKPVGMVWIAWQRREGSGRAQEFHFDGDRDAVRRHTVAAALEGIRKILTT